MEKLSNKEFNEIWRKKTNSTTNSYILMFLRSYSLTLLRSLKLIINP
jgi:hypothetical protein